ncbi:hypothetical protein H9P43_001527 [Blastocladiella emersonii ATCC 22665]|nr:hypothetical protein H9P43_001527 [Blastocladiella emersonii ATCC 22665]
MSAPGAASAPAAAAPTASLTAAGIGEDEFRSAIQKQLRQAGVADELKAQLRARIIDHLSAPSLTAMTAQSAARCPLLAAPANGGELKHGGEGRNLVHSLANALVVDFLANHGLQYSLSVYLPETSQATPPAMDVDEMLELLRLSDPTAKRGPLLTMLNELSSEHGSDHSLIERLILSVRRLAVRSASQQIQTETADPTDLVREQTGKVEQEREAARKALTNLARKHEAEFDARLHEELERRMEAFRETEAKRIQLEARETIISKYEQVRESAEQKYEAHSSKLRLEVDEIKSKLRAREAELEAQYTERHQKLSREIDSLRVREESLRNQYQALQQTKALDESLLTRQVEELKRRIEAVLAEKEDVANQMTRELESARASCAREQAEYMSKLRLQESKLSSDQQLLDERKRQMERFMREEESVKSELLATRQIVTQYQKQIAALQEELQHARSDRPRSTESDRMSSGETAQLQRELADVRRSLEHAISQLQKSSPMENVTALKQSEQKWQTECQGLIQRLDREYRRNEELERQLDATRTAKHELKLEVTQLRVLLHQMSIPAGRVNPVGHIVETESPRPILPDPLSAINASPSKGRRTAKRGLRETRGRERDRDRDSSADSLTNDEDTDMQGHMSRESLISDISAVELRILRGKAGESSPSSPTRGYGSDTAVLPGGYSRSSRRGSREVLSYNEMGGGSSANAALMGTKRRSISIGSTVMIDNNNELGSSGRVGFVKRNSRDLNDSGSEDSGVPHDLSGQEKRILTKRGSREISFGAAVSDPIITSGLNYGLGMTAGSVGEVRANGTSSPPPVSTVPLAAADATGSVPSDLSSSELKILSKRSSRDFAHSPTVDHAATPAPVPVQHEMPAARISRAESGDSLISDMSVAELRLLADQVGPAGAAAGTNPLADIDAQPRRVHMSRESLISDLSTFEKKLLVKGSHSAGHSTRSSMEDLLGSGTRQLFERLESASHHGSVTGSCVHREERKVVILSRDTEAGSRESLASVGRHVAFTTTDEEHEVNTEEACKRVAFGAREQHIVETNDDAEDLDAARPRLVSFDETEKTKLAVAAAAAVTGSATPAPATGLGSRSSSPPGLAQPPARDKSPKPAAAAVPEPVPTAEDKKAAEARKQEEQVKAITAANPALAEYMKKAAVAAGAAPPGLPAATATPAAAATARVPVQAKVDEEEDSTDFGAGETISAATTSTGTSS